MQCPKCGNENPEDACVCGSCCAAITEASGTGDRIVPVTSALAILSLALGVMSPVSLGLTSLPAIVLGIIAIVKIERSGGRITGRPYAVIGILVSVLIFFTIPWPMVLKERRQAFRMVCASNLSHIGKAMLIYVADYDGEYPRSGGPDSRWAGQIPNWMAPDHLGAYGLTADGVGGVGSISSSFYLLVKYADAPLETFVCPGDSGTALFDPAGDPTGDKKLTDFWDFGARPRRRCSYSYHHPFGLYHLTASSEPGMPVAADRNPFMKAPRKKPKKISLFNPEGGRKAVRAGNAWQHENDGQNVLFLGGYVSFRKVPYCGVDDDNIYTFWDGGDIRRGTPPALGSQPQDKADSLLVHDSY